MQYRFAVFGGTVLYIEDQGGWWPGRARDGKCGDVATCIA